MHFFLIYSRWTDRSEPSPLKKKIKKIKRRRKKATTTTKQQQQQEQKTQQQTNNNKKPQTNKTKFCPGVVYAMRSLVPVGHFRNISGHLFTWLVCGSFQWRHGLLFTDCIVWDNKDKVIGFKRSLSIHLGWWNTGSPKLQLFQIPQHSHVTNCWLISSSAFFP